MSAPSASAEPQPSASQDTAPSLAQLAGSTFAQLHRLIANTLGLAALEARLAALSLISIVAAALAAAFALMAFWLILQATLIVAITRLGIDLLWVLAGFTVLNGALIALCLAYIRRLSGNLKFKATATALRGSGMHATPETRDSP